MDRRPAVFVLLAALAHALAGATYAQPLDRPPTTPASPTVAVHSPTFAVVRWQRSTDDRGAVAGYEVLRDEVSLGIFDALSYVDRDLLPGRGYNYVILAIDSAGQRSLRATVRAVTPDAIPSPPTGVRADVYSRTAAELFWDRSLVFGQRYEVKRDGEVVATTDGTSHFDDTLTDARPYLYEVIALNRQGERSAPVRLFVDTGERGLLPAGPEAPGGLRAAVYSSTAVEVFWERPATIGVVYEVRRDGVLLATTDGTSWFDDTLAGGTSHTYEVIAIDPGGRRSTPSSVMLSTPADSAPPPASVSSVIGVDNHVELIAEAFDLYVGRPYADEVVRIVHPAVRGHAAGELSSVTACDNGGTATVVAEGRVAFDDCQIDDAVFDGIGEAPFNPFGWHLVAEGLVVERSPARRLELDGDMRRLYSSTQSDHIEVWETTAATIRLVTPEGSVSVSEATSSFSFGVAVAGEFTTIYSGRVSGGFTFRSPLSDDRAIRAEIPVTFFRPTESRDDPFGADDDFTEGQLRLSAEDGSALVLDAATGDETSVNVEIVVDGERERFVQPWSLWHERLRFDEAPTD